MTSHADGSLISVIIPTRGRAKLLAKVLEALAAQTLSASQFEVIVVMDGPDAATEQMLRGRSFPYSLSWLSQPHKGTAAARGLGVGAARAPVLVFIDDDIIATPEFLHAHYAAHQQESQVVVLGALKPPPGSVAGLPGQADDWTQAHFNRCSMGGYQPVWTDLLGANFSVSKDAVLRAGGWDEEFQGYGGNEDRDLALRLGRLGMRFRFEAEALGYHYQTKGWVHVLRDVRQAGRSYPHYLEKHAHDMRGISWAASSPWRRLLYRAIGLCPELAFKGLYALARLTDRIAANGGSWRPLQGLVRLSVNAVFLRGVWETPEAARQILRNLSTQAHAAPAPVKNAARTRVERFGKTF